MTDVLLVKNDSYVNRVGQLISVNEVIKLIPLEGRDAREVPEYLFVGHTGTIYRPDGRKFYVCDDVEGISTDIEDLVYKVNRIVGV